jgi:hypothetical protein
MDVLTQRNGMSHQWGDYMFEVNTGNLEQNAECFAAHHANSPVAVDDVLGRWSMAGLLWAGIVACLLVQ